jgi:micrococcal nuclease
MTVAYRYRAQLVRVIDGDTYELDVDLGFHVHTRITVRLRGWDCQERFTETGKLATAAAAAIITGPLIVETEKVHLVADTQSFARYVADVWTDAGHVGELLAARGLATPR